MQGHTVSSLHARPGLASAHVHGASEGEQSRNEQSESVGLGHRIDWDGHLPDVEAVAAGAQIERITDGGEDAGFSEASAGLSEKAITDFQRLTRVDKQW